VGAIRVGGSGRLASTGPLAFTGSVTLIGAVSSNPADGDWTTVGRTTTERASGRLTKGRRDAVIGREAVMALEAVNAFVGVYVGDLLKGPEAV
jgi:hypothetical protein